MTQEQFIKILKKNNITYEINQGKIIITHGWSIVLKKQLKSLPEGIVFSNLGDVHLTDITSLPSDVVFNNKGEVTFNSLTSISPGVVFNNEGKVGLYYLIDLPTNVVFSNKGKVSLWNLKTIHSGVVFNNQGDVDLEAIIDPTIRSLSLFSSWHGNIKGIESNKLLNKMIKDKVFER
jgi:hypothetical protein